MLQCATALMLLACKFHFAELSRSLLELLSMPISIGRSEQPLKHIRLRLTTESYHLHRVSVGKHILVNTTPRGRRGEIAVGMDCLWGWE